MDSKKFLTAKTLIPAAICLVAILGVTYYYLFAAMSLSGKDAKIFIDKDDNLDSIMVKLDTIATESGKTGFCSLARFIGYGESVRPGMYVLNGSVGPLSFLRKLRNGQQDFMMLTVPTARTMEELSRKLGGKLQVDSASYMQVLTDSTMIAELGFTKETLPAMFIPETYDFFWTDNAEKVVRRMADEYKKFWTDERQEKAKAIGLTPNEVSTLASIVDSETNVDSDKPIVAGVYLNRLARDIKLEADPTVKFAVGDFTLRRILNKHLAVESPYNTYKNTGLPPGPICIPTISGIDAVLNAAKHNYIFFCASPKFDGSHIFAETYAEHQANARKYHEALNARNIK